MQFMQKLMQVFVTLQVILDIILCTSVYSKGGKSVGKKTLLL